MVKIHISMTESQFATFRADVRTAAGLAAKEMSAQIKKEVYDSVVLEARATAAQTVRKDLDRASEFAQSVANENRHLSSRISGVSMDVQRLIERLSTAEDNILRLSATNTAVLEKLGKLGKSKEPSLSEIYTLRYGPTQSEPKNGDQCESNGEWFTFWWGQWRRQSELEGFASWMASRASRS